VKPNEFLLFIFIFAILASCQSKVSNNPDHVKWADSIAERTYTLMDLPDNSRALSYLDSVYNVTPDRGVADLWRKYNAKVAYYSNYKHDLSARKIYVDSMFTLLSEKESIYKFEYAHTLFARANLLRKEKKYNQAFRYYYEGRSFAEKNLDRCSMGDFSNSLGIIQYQQGEFQKAIPYLKQAFNEIQTCKNSNFHYGFILPQSILNTTALCFEKSQESDSAVYYYHKALDFIHSKKNAFSGKEVFTQVALAVVEGNLGGVYATMNNFSEAEKHLKKSIENNDRNGYAIEDAKTAKMKLARLYITHNRLPQAAELLGQIEEDFKTGRGSNTAYNEIRTKWLQAKWLYHDKTGNIAQAYKYNQEFHKFSDSLDVVNSGLKGADMEHIFREQQQKYQLSLLQKNNELKSVYLIALIIFLVMAIGLALVTWYYLNRSRKSVKELKELNHRKKLTLEALENSQKENTKMLKIVAHDLRNPIGAISSLAAAMREDSNRSEDDRMALELMQTAGEDSLELVNNLLNLNAPSSGDFSKEPHDLAELIHYCTDLLRFRAQEKNQKIELNTIPVMVRLNYEKMWRVISNLISNAIKFSPDGETITISVKQVERDVLITVQDHGIGIPPALKDKIFDMFTQAGRSGTAGEESYGLGLAISRQIVEAHGGKIWFESVSAAGTTFYIELPA
jgi:signal transduction histidine kinase